MAEFPTDIVADILSRLPVKPILRFRCVSKPWCALIDTPHFAKSHLKRSIKTRTNRQLLLSEAFSDDITVYTMMDDSSFDAADKLQLPPSNQKDEFCLASCDGLVLILLLSEFNFAIWNPFTRNYRVLPISTTPFLFENELGYDCGIGYDSVHDDYKVVKMEQFSLGAIHTQVQVYSLKMNSWISCFITEDLPYYLLIYGSRLGMLASGALHWAACETDHGILNVIVAFDLATEEFRTVPMPSLHRMDSVHFYALASLEGFLCLHSETMDGFFNVWVMKDYGVKESWTKLLTVPPQSFTETFDFRFPVTLTFSMDGTKVLLLQRNRTLFWYDLKHKVVQTVDDFCDLPYISDVQFCVQSLVPLGKDDTVNRMKQHKEEINSRKPKEI